MNFNPTKIKKIISVILTVISFQVYATVDLGDLRPDNISDAKWASLQEVMIESKLLPTPEGIGGATSNYGESVAIDGNRALIGSPRTLEHGVAYILDYDGNTWVETQIIIPDGLNASNRFGISVSLQGDRALIGDLFDGENGNQSGAAYIYELTNGSWVQTQKLLASDGGSNDKFGISVSLSGDRALIGAVSYDDVTNGANSGAAYVFDFDGSDWQQTTILKANIASSGDQLGVSVSLDGDKALVGTSLYDDNNNGVNTGAAYLFELDTGVWSQTKQFIASDGADDDKFGIAVSLSGNRVAIGASQTDENVSNSGSVYIYDFDTVSEIWAETKLTANDASIADQFGVSVSLQGNRFIVGARYGIGNSSGSAYIFDFDNSNNSWSQTEIFSSDGVSGDYFSSGVAVSGDRVLIGAKFDDDNGTQSGSAYVFDLDETWQQSHKLTTQGAVDDNFGYAVSLDGDRALIGAPYDENGNGAAYIFDYVNGSWSEPVKLLSSEPFQNFGMALSLSGDKAIISANLIEFAGSGLVYIFEFNGTTWVETTILESDSTPNDEFGFSVSISGDRVLVGAPFANENGARSGAAYVYELISGTWQQTDKLIPTDGQSDDLFGTSVSLRADRALIGAYTKDDDINGLSRVGAAYIFDYNANTDMWLETKLPLNDPHQQDFFGSSVDLGNNRAVVGARNGFANSPQRGYAYIYDFDELTQTWDGVKIFTTDGSSSDSFGNSVSLDGDRVFVSAYFNANDGIRTGSVFQYDFDGSNWLETKKHFPNDGVIRDFYGWSVSSSNGNVLIGAYQDDDRGTDSGSVYSIIDDLIFADGYEN